MTRPTAVEDAPSPQGARAVTLPSAWAGSGSRHEPETGCSRHGLGLRTGLFDLRWVDDDSAYDRSLYLAGGLALLACAAAHSQQPATFTPEQLRQDVTAIEAAIERTHPDIAHSVDPAVLGRAIEDIRAKLDHPMSAGEAWTVLSRLNSVMADGHLAVTYPGGAANEIRQYAETGRTLVSVRRARDTGGRDFRSRQTR